MEVIGRFVVEGLRIRGGMRYGRESRRRDAEGKEATPTIGRGVCGRTNLLSCVQIVRRRTSAWQVGNAFHEVSAAGEQRVGGRVSQVDLRGRLANQVLVTRETQKPSGVPGAFGIDGLGGVEPVTVTGPDIRPPRPPVSHFV